MNRIVSKKILYAGIAATLAWGGPLYVTAQNSTEASPDATITVDTGGNTEQTQKPNQTPPGLLPNQALLEQKKREMLMLQAEYQKRLGEERARLFEKQIGSTTPAGSVIMPQNSNNMLMNQKPREQNQRASSTRSKLVPFSPERKHGLALEVFRRALEREYAIIQRLAAVTKELDLRVSNTTGNNTDLTNLLETAKTKIREANKAVDEAKLELQNALGTSTSTRNPYKTARDLIKNSTDKIREAYNSLKTLVQKLKSVNQENLSTPTEEVAPTETTP